MKTQSTVRSAVHDIWAPPSAQAICGATDQQVTEIFHALMLRRQLRPTVQLLNGMMTDPKSAELARDALNRLGLNHAG